MKDFNLNWSWEKNRDDIIFMYGLLTGVPYTIGIMHMAANQMLDGFIFFLITLTLTSVITIGISKLDKQKSRELNKPPGELNGLRS
jgi:hypothetical protein